HLATLAARSRGGSRKPNEITVRQLACSESEKLQQTPILKEVLRVSAAVCLSDRARPARRRPLAMVARMRIGLVGAGGVGGIIAGLLSRAGHDVAVVARGAMLEAVRDHGLRIDSPLGTFAARVEAAGAPGEIAPVDAMLVAVKAWQVRQVAATLAPSL